MSLSRLLQVEICSLLFQVLLLCKQEISNFIQAGQKPRQTARWAVTATAHAGAPLGNILLPFKHNY
jgi:hypothetical protein